jgi:hypothetical protein
METLHEYLNNPSNSLEDKFGVALNALQNKDLVKVVLGLSPILDHTNETIMAINMVNGMDLSSLTDDQLERISYASQNIGHKQKVLTLCGENNASITFVKHLLLAIMGINNSNSYHHLMQALSVLSNNDRFTDQLLESLLTVSRSLNHARS